MTAISAARAHAERIEPETTPSWLYWLSPASIAANAGDALLRLNRPERAEPLLADSAAHLHLGDRQYFLVRLATSQLQNDKLDNAAATGHGALDLTDRQFSPRTRDDVRSLYQDMKPHEYVPVVREFLDRAREMVA
jgi:hypothetical protein